MFCFVDYKSHLLPKSGKAIFSPVKMKRWPYRDNGAALVAAYIFKSLPSFVWHLHIVPTKKQFNYSKAKCHILTTNFFFNSFSTKKIICQFLNTSDLFFIIWLLGRTRASTLDTDLLSHAVYGKYTVYCVKYVIYCYHDVNFQTKRLASTQRHAVSTSS